MQQQQQRENVRTFYPHLLGQTDRLLKHSQEQRKDLDICINLLNDKMNIEDQYLKSMQKLLQNISKIQTDSFFLNGLRVNIQNKVDQVEVLVQVMRDEIITFSKQLYNQQSDMVKRISDEAKQLEKDLKKKQEWLNEINMDYRQKSREAESCAIYDLLYQFDLSVPEDKKFKQTFFTQQVVEESLEEEKEYSLTLQQYNEFLEIYKTKMESIYQTLESQEKERILWYKDALVKLVIFESAQLKNIQYDLDKLAEKVQTVDPEKSFQETVLKFYQESHIPQSVQFRKMRTFTATTLNSIRDKSYHRRQIESKDFQPLFHHIDVSEEDLEETLKDYQIKTYDIKNEMRFIYTIMLLSFKGVSVQTEHLIKLTELLRVNEQARQMWVCVLNHCVQKQQHELSSESYKQVIILFRIFLDIIFEEMDVSCGRALLIPATTFYTVDENQKQILVMDQIKHHKLFKARDFFEASIIEQIYDTLYEEQKVITQRSVDKKIERQKHLFFKAILTICFHMMLITQDYHGAAYLVDKYAEMCDLPEELTEQLHNQIEDIKKR